jgi:hypothetical protein
LAAALRRVDREVLQGWAIECVVGELWRVIEPLSLDTGELLCLAHRQCLGGVTPGYEAGCGDVCPLAVDGRWIYPQRHCGTASERWICANNFGKLVLYAFGDNLPILRREDGVDELCWVVERRPDRGGPLELDAISVAVSEEVTVELWKSR